MFKVIFWVAVIAFTVAFFTDRSALTPWEEALKPVAGTITNAVRSAGEATKSEMSDVERGNSVLNKVPGAVSAAVGSVASTVTN